MKYFLSLFIITFFLSISSPSLFASVGPCEGQADGDEITYYESLIKDVNIKDSNLKENAIRKLRDMNSEKSADVLIGFLYNPSLADVVAISLSRMNPQHTALKLMDLYPHLDQPVKSSVTMALNLIARQLGPKNSLYHDIRELLNPSHREKEITFADPNTAEVVVQKLFNTILNSNRLEEKAASFHRIYKIYSEFAAPFLMRVVTGGAEHKIFTQMVAIELLGKLPSHEVVTFLIETGKLTPNNVLRFHIWNTLFNMKEHLDPTVAKTIETIHDDTVSIYLPTTKAENHLYVEYMDILNQMIRKDIIATQAEAGRLIQVLKNPSESEVYDAVVEKLQVDDLSSFEEMGESAFVALLEIALGTNPVLKQAAKDALKLLGVEASGYLLDFIASPSFRALTHPLQEEVLWLLAYIEASEALDFLTDVMRNGVYSVNVRITAAIVLNQLVEKAPFEVQVYVSKEIDLAGYTSQVEDHLADSSAKSESQSKVHKKPVDLDPLGELEIAVKPHIEALNIENHRDIRLVIKAYKALKENRGEALRQLKLLVESNARDSVRFVAFFVLRELSPELGEELRNTVTMFEDHSVQPQLARAFSVIEALKTYEDLCDQFETDGALDEPFLESRLMFDTHGYNLDVISDFFIEQGAPVLPSVIDLIYQKYNDQKIPVTLLHTIPHMGQDAAPYLIGIARDPNKLADMLFLLGYFRTPESQALMVDSLTHENKNVRKIARKSILKWFPALAQENIGQMMGDFLWLFDDFDANVDIISEMELLLTKLDFIVFEEVKMLLPHPNFEIRMRAVNILGNMKNSFLLPKFVKLLGSDPRQEVREICVTAIARLKTKDNKDELKEILIYALKRESSPSVSQAIMTAIDHLDQRRPSRRIEKAAKNTVLEDMLAGLMQTDLKQRNAAVQALKSQAMIAEHRKEVAAALIDFVKALRRDDSLFNSCHIALGILSEIPTENAEDFLISMLGHPKFTSAVIGLLIKRGTVVLPKILGLLKSSKSGVRWAAYEIISDMFFNAGVTQQQRAAITEAKEKFTGVYPEEFQNDAGFSPDLQAKEGLHQFLDGIISDLID